MRIGPFFYISSPLITYLFWFSSPLLLFFASLLVVGASFASFRIAIFDPSASYPLFCLLCVSGYISAFNVCILLPFCFLLLLNSLFFCFFNFQLSIFSSFFFVYLSYDSLFSVALSLILLSPSVTHASLLLISIGTLSI